MIETGFDARVKISQIIENQLPEFLLSESSKAVDFLKQYYISQEYQGGTVDIVENLDQYLKLDNFTKEVLKGKTELVNDISASSTTISVVSTKGFPKQYGLLKIDDEIITYTGISGNTFTGCVRGFSGVTAYNKINDPENLEFSTSKSSTHSKNAEVTNLSALFLKEFYKKLKYSLTPGLENSDFVSDLDVNNFIKEAKSLYQSKGTPESFRILFNVLYGETPTVFDLENLLIKPSAATYVRREIVVAELLNPPANPLNLIGQTITKSTDLNAQSAISEVEILTRNRKTYYKLSLFVGYDDNNTIKGQFNIQPKTKVIENVSVGSSVISVDSTIGFGQTGTLISGTNKISYTKKSINQFFGCTGILSSISKTNDIRSDELVYGYENGDKTKKVELRITGVLSKFVPDSKIYRVNDNEVISVKNIGEVIQNPQSNRTHKEIFANSWIYNTSSRYQVKNIFGSIFTLFSTIDQSSLRKNDIVEILERGSEIIVSSDCTITNIDYASNAVSLSNIQFSPVETVEYDVRRKIKKASSSAISLEFGNNNLISDIQNLYVDGDDYAYVASNSLPSYTITKKLTMASIPEASVDYIKNFNETTLKYSQISFVDYVPFKSGDAVVYKPSNPNKPIPGLISGQTYYVQVLNPNNTIRLYISRSFVGGNSYIQFEPLDSGTGSHKFVLLREKSEIISPQKILRKFPLHPNLSKSSSDKTEPGAIGLLINGVEIISPKSNDKVYYGPIQNIKILNSGKNYDVINPPKLVIDPPLNGTTALSDVVVRGSVKKITVDPQEFDLETVVSASLSGGNGSGCILNPIISKRYREIEFDARPLINGGGLDLSNETITFEKVHNFVGGEPIIYNQNGNFPLGIGSFGLSETTGTLVSGATYYPKIINNSTIQLYPTLSNYISGINTIGITTVNNYGIHKFRTLEKNTLRTIEVINSGSNYENRLLRVKPIGISTFNHSISFNNHNFKNGDLIKYEATSTAISGLSTTSNYYVLKLDDNTFRLSDAGIGTITSSNFDRKNFVKFYSVGSGYHIFKYPEIEVTVNVSYGGTVIRQLEAVPTVVGSIVDTYVYENGSGYGDSNLVNIKKTPKITIKNGKDAVVYPFVKDGKIIKVDVLSKGSEYFSTPELIVQGSGSGAILRPIIENQKIVDVIIINAGIGYTQTDISVKTVSSGSGALLEANIRSLTVNEQYIYNTEILTEFADNLEYGWVGYSTNLAKNSFNDFSGSHSPIIGWAYDGNPIYGPYGYSDPEDNNSELKILKPGYLLNTSQVFDRPSTTVFPEGFFIEDYNFNDSGDLDVHNGRYCKTPEFPLGTYAYFVGVNTSTTNLDPIYPYFIGDTYRSEVVKENSLLNQSFDFNNSNLSRNTFPYKVSDPYASNDFIVESNEVINQTSQVQSILSGSVNSLKVIEPGNDYKVGDLVNFDNNGTEGGGLSAYVSSLEGKDITSVTSQVETYNSSVFEWKDSNNVIVYCSPYHQLLDNDTVIVSGLSASISPLLKSHKIGVVTSRTILFSELPSSTPGSVADLYVSYIPETVSIGSSIVIENEILRVLNIFPTNSIIRARRSDVGSAHTISTNISILPNKITIPVKTDYFDSKFNDKLFFNPKQSVGIGTTVGGEINLSYTVGVVTSQISVPIQSIYLPSHPFKTGQQVILSKCLLDSSFTVSNTSNGSTFNLPSTGNSTETVYVINKSKDFIGLTTTVGLTTNTEGLFFRTNGSDSYEYALESNFTQVTGNISKINATFVVSDPHEMKNEDKIKLFVNPNLSVGVGQSSKVRLKYENTIQRLVVNPIGFTSSSINSTTNIITLTSHQLKTGDKIFYNSSDEIASGLSTGNYYICKIDDNKIQLAETLIDSQSYPPNIVNIIGIGGSRHEISLVNPQLICIKNNNVVFDVSDSSLFGNKLKFYYDSNFNNEFVGLGNSSSFNIIGVGTIGVSSTSTVTLKYSLELPSVLYYNLEKSGYISTSDKDVQNYSQISFVDSVYSGTYKISGIGTTTFTISLEKNPEKLSYASSECSILKYNTTSKTAKGGVDKLNIIFNGYNYKKEPKFLNISSSNGKNANIVVDSSNIGLIDNIKILNSGYEYSADHTLRPEAYISPFVQILNFSKIKKVNVLNGGKNYFTSPKLIVKNPITNTIVDNNSSLKANIYSNSISSVEIVSPIYGLSSVEHEIILIDNQNGVGINSIISSSGSGVVTCILSTPVLGFSTFANPFSVGDKVFVENIQREGSSGTGFNSEDYNYSYFDVLSYTNSNPAVLEYSMSTYTTNPGLAKTIQSAFAMLINKKNLPQFEVIQESSSFDLGERLLSDFGNGFELRDLYVTKFGENYIKVKGSYTLSTGEKIKGQTSGSIASIGNITKNKGKFEIDYSTKNIYAWVDDIGKLNELNQVSSNNDYYQNLSYTVKSSIEYENLINPVNRLLHTAGLKNFSDTQIESKSLVGYGVTYNTDDLITLDITEEKRVDSINNYDLTLDINTYDKKSKYLKLKNKRLSSYIDCISNRVLVIDDISNQFSNTESNNILYSNISTIDKTYYNYLVQIRDTNTTKLQVFEIVVLSNQYSIFTLEKSLLGNTDTLLGSLVGIADEFDVKSLRFSPADPYTTDYEIKILQSEFNTDLVGINTQAVGFVNLIGINTSVGIGTTITITSFDKNKFKSLFAKIQIINTTNGEMNYVELFLDHDNMDTYISEYYFDTSNGSSQNFFGSFDSNIVGNNINLKFYNDENNSLLIKSNIVGFGTTSVGIGTYRFILPGQIVGNERSALLQSNYAVSSSVIDVVEVVTQNVSSVKSFVRVSYGQTSALHQVLMIHDNNNVYTLQYPFLSIGSTTGIGTFGGEFSGTKTILKFYPDNNSNTISLESFNEILYTENDYKNTAPDLEYGPITEKVILSTYSAKKNKVNFDLNYQGTPIYAKKFDPSNSSQLDPSTGIFTIKNHFFNTGEQLIYTPQSTFIGIAATSVGIGSTLNSSGIVTTILPTDVYAINVNSDQFKLSTRKDYALAGIYVTFTSTGSGNSHQLEMSKKLEKSIISVNNVVQKPITYVPISFLLQNNGGQIGVANTYISISGIASIRPKDILKIDNEFISVTSVGVGTTSSGPITGIGTYNLVEVKRGFIGSSATTHTDSSIAQLYRGSFNIIDSEIYFTEAPKGSGETSNNIINSLPAPYSEFNGRVYLRNDYSSNLIFDDISDNFTGIGKTYNLSLQGISTTGIETGSGILFINDVFQTPTTVNNIGNNFEVATSSGISSVVFTGITSSNGDLIISNYDINQNQLPRGGMIVSLGSTPGEGYAPLVGALVKATIGVGGSITSVVSTAYTGTGKNVSTASYNNLTGIVEITTTTAHELNGGDLIKLVGLAFTCPSSGITSYFPLSGLSGSYGVSGIKSENTFSAFVGYSTLPHTYVGMGTIFPWYNLNPGSGYRNPVSIGITDSNHSGTAANISAIVGVGGSLSFIINNGGSGYSTSTVKIQTPQPSYDNLSVIGVSRIGIGSTTDTGYNLLITLDVGPISTTGIGSTLFEVSTFKISRPGYGFKVGDVFKPVGLVTAKGLVSPVSEFELTVLDTFTDSFSAWQFGELDYIDSIKNMQDGVRVRFPLYYNSRLLSFEKNPNSSINLNALLLIFINGVIQEPEDAYQFDGGTTFTFSTPPKPEDQVSIFFYRGTRDVDSKQKSINETVKIGDLVQVYKNDLYNNTITQNIRRIDNIPSSDTLETNIYTDQGIDETYYKPLTWTKQKIDQIINGDFVYKSRDSLETQIYPTAKIIKNVGIDTNSIFVDDARFFNYEENDYSVVINNFSAIITQSVDPVSAGLTATVSAAGTIQSLHITNPGSGYIGTSITVKISAPPNIKSGVGTIAVGIVSISNGSITTPIAVTNPGLGYSQLSPPQVIVESPPVMTENVTKIIGVDGFSGIVTGITTSVGTGGHPLAIKLFLNRSPNFTGLQVGYPIYVYNTSVGLGITSVDSTNTSKVGIGTTYCDNIYYIHSISYSGPNAEIISNIHSDTNIVGLATTGSTTSPVGKFSWGRLYNFTRSNPVSIAVTGLTVDSGLSTFPTIQRRGYGFRDTGALKKTIS